MRNRNIKSVAHWVIMSFILLFPIVLVGLSSFANTTETNINYKYETNDVSSYEDLKDGNIYHFDSDDVIHGGDGPTSFVFWCYDFYNVDTESNSTYYQTSQTPYISYIRVCFRYNFNNDVYYLYDVIDKGHQAYGYGYSSISFDFVYRQCVDAVLPNIECISRCVNVPIDNISVDYASMKQDIVNWIDDFINLPVNSWYLSLMDILSIPFVSSGVMSVIYIYPLYVVWVYVFDFIADIFLFFVKLGHDLLQKLGGKNE